MKKSQLVPTTLALLIAATAAQASVTGKTIRETAEWATRRFVKEAGEEGAEQLAKRMAQLAARHGEDLVAQAVKKVGPRAMDIATSAGAQADVALRLLAKHGDDAVLAAGNATSRNLVAKFGDDAAAAILKHGSVGESLVGRFSAGGAKALASVSPQNGRRLAMLAEDGQLAAPLMDVVARYGDRACGFIWQNRKALAVGAVLTAFVADPEPFLNGTVELTNIVASEVVKPAIEQVVAPVVTLPVQAATAAASRMPWTLLASAAVAAWLLWTAHWGWFSPGLLLRWGWALARRWTRRNPAA